MVTELSFEVATLKREIETQKAQGKMMREQFDVIVTQSEIDLQTSNSNRQGGLQATNRALESDLITTPKYGNTLNSADKLCQSYGELMANEEVNQHRRGKSSQLKANQGI